MLTVVEKTIAPIYRRFRRLKNRALNLVDPPVIVLAYHRVTRLAADPHQLAVLPEHFRAQMQYLRQNCHCVRFEEDWQATRGPSVAVTFDDGYADNLYQALPILEQTGVPATFFISTGIVGTRNEFWSDELAHLLLGEGDTPARFSLQDREYAGSWTTASREQRRELHDRLHRRMLTIKPQRRENWLAQLSAWAGAGRAARDAYRALTHEELQKLANSPLVTIGAHGVSHTPLTVLSEEEQYQEIIQSRSGLEKLLDREVTVFSYPFGGHRQFDRTTRRLCRQAGVRRAVTTLPGQVHRWTDPWQMPRQLVRNWDVATFAARLERFWT